MAYILAIANQKGGVAKTTTTMNLADILVSQGKHVLVIDGDAQGSLTTNYGFDREQLEKEGKTLAHCLAGQALLSETIVGADLKFIGSSSLLNYVDYQLTDDFTIFSSLLKSIRGDFDYIIIDCGPGLTRVMRNALGGADGVVVPVKTDKTSTEGVGLLVETIHNLSERVNPKLKIVGILPTMYKKQYKADRDTLSDLKKQFKGVVVVFNPIPFSTWYDRAAVSFLSVFRLR